MEKKHNRKIIDELLMRQNTNIPLDKKLHYSDIIRIAKYIESSIFVDECCLWNGYITNYKNVTKGTYINFFFRNKKVALHRLLYNNYTENLQDDEYLKFSCDNRGKCCNINHMIKYKYNIGFKLCNKKSKINKLKNKDIDNKNNNLDDFIIIFD
jgi:hypothetical protein